MKKFVLMIVPALICGLMFTGCNSKKEIEEIEEKLANLTEVDIVKAQIGNFEIASVKHEDIELELNELSFPTTIPDNYLEQIVERIGITISDTQAKTGLVGVKAYNSVGKNIGYFTRFSNDGYDNLQLRWYAEYIYSDRSFTKKGQTTEMGNPDSGVLFDCSFEKGWNIIYFSLAERKYTTQKPADKYFNWYYNLFGID